MGTDCEKTPIYALQDIILFTKYNICLWYIDKNILINCKPSFDIKES